MRARYAAYKRGEVDETTMCGEMVTMHKGAFQRRKIMDAATRFFDEFFVLQIFPEMRELVRRLQENECEVWAVSSSNEWVIRAAMKHFGIPENRILAAKVEVDDGIATDRLIRTPSGPANGRHCAKSRKGNRRRIRQFALGCGNAGDGETRLRGQSESLISNPWPGNAAGGFTFPRARGELLSSSL
jgi:phosphoserine phosphatase